MQSYELKDFVQLVDQEKKAVATACVGLLHNNITQFFTSSITGKIVLPHGNHGYGFDSILEMPNGQTLAEIRAYDSIVYNTKTDAFNHVKKYIEKIENTNY